MQYVYPSFVAISLQTAPEDEVECSAAIKVDFDDGATMITNSPYKKVGTDAVAAGHHISKQHLKDTVAGMPSILLGESDVSQGQAVLSAADVCIMHASLCTHA